MKFIVLLFVAALLACHRRTVPAAPRAQLPKAPRTTVIVDSLPPVSEPPAPAAPYRLLRLQRTPCYGKCPHYAVDVYSNGLVLYEGKNYVPLRGTYESRLTETDLAALRDELARSDFFQLAARYPAEGLKDLPGTVLTVTNTQRRSHRVQVIFDPPPQLQDLIDHVDRLVERSTFLELR